MSKYFKDYCVKPIYFIEDKDKAASCGTYTGLFNGMVVYTFICIASYRFYNKKNKEKIKFILIVSFFFLIILYPLFLYRGKKIEWEGYKKAYEQLLTEGYSKKDAILMLQGFDTHTPTAPTLGATVANTLFLSRRPERRERQSINNSSFKSTQNLNTTNQNIDNNNIDNNNIDNNDSDLLKYY